MNRHSDRWSKSELIQLKKEYTLGKMTVDNISVIHGRLPDSIVHKLKGLGIILNSNDARGYSNLPETKKVNKVAKHQQEFIQREYTRAMYGLTKRKPNSKQQIEESPNSQVWTDDEVVQLLKLVHAKKHIDEIAAIHLRTEDMIISKLKALAVDYHIYDKRSISQIEKFTGLSKDTILAAIAENEKQDNLTSDDTQTVDTVEAIETVPTVECTAEPFIKEIMKAMKTIQDDMKTILEKIDSQNIKSPNTNATNSNTLSLGKHKGKSYDFVKQNDVSYCNWVLKQKNFGGKMLDFQIWLKSHIES